MDRNRFRLYVALAVFFLLGAAVGSAWTVLYMKNRIERFVSGGPTARQAFLVNRITRELDLTPAQQEEVAAILEEGHRDLTALRERHRPEARRILDRQFERIGALLNAEQKKKFGDFRERFRPERRMRGGMHHGPPL